MPHLRVVRVAEEGEAARKGICAEDIIVSYGGKEVQTDEDFEKAISAATGDSSQGSVEIVIRRNRHSKSLAVATGALGLRTATIDVDLAVSIELLSTTDEVDGYTTVKNLGLVRGSTVRSRNVGSEMGASLKAIVGGELKGVTKLIADGREQAFARMCRNAEWMGAVLGCNLIRQFNQFICINMPKPESVGSSGNYGIKSIQHAKLFVKRNVKYRPAEMGCAEILCNIHTFHIMADKAAELIQHIIIFIRHIHALCHILPTYTVS